jgi:hypothetical protein
MPATCKFTIKVYNDKLNKIIKSVHIHCVDRLRLDEALDDIKQTVLDRTESYIDNMRRRPSETSKLHLIDVLRETSNVKKLDNYTYRLGIGDENVLNSKVPYWKILNYGGIPPDWAGKSFFGTFTDGRPKEGAGGEAWLEGWASEEGKRFMMKPKKPIPPMRYLAYMAKQFSMEVLKFRVRVKGK